MAGPPEVATWMEMFVVNTLRPLFALFGRS